MQRAHYLLQMDVRVEELRSHSLAVLALFQKWRNGAEFDLSYRETTMKSIACVLLFFAIYSVVVHCIDDKCAACNAVAEEIERGLSNEKPRNHLDMRHRLDSKGQRKGKVIDYRISELRVVELLDGLCEKMQDYTLEKTDSGRREWIKVNNWDNLTNQQEARAYSKDISTYCGRLLEEAEDDLAELIKKGTVKVGDVNKVLCHDLSRHCSEESVQLNDDEDEADGEL